MTTCHPCYFEKNFRKKFTEGAPQSCWLWRGAGSDGYGHVKVGSTMEGAHRVAYRLFVQPIPRGAHVLHACDERRCVNPAHLHVGTHADNMREKAERGRAVAQRGAANPRALLTRAQVVEVRRLYRPRAVSITVLAERFGVARSSIHRIIHGRSYSCS